MQRVKTTIADIEAKETEFLTPQEVSDILGISRHTFMDSCKNGAYTGLFTIVKIGQRYKIVKKDFLEFVFSKTNA